eukprot:1157919-Pelagomonas_calceolata.AAC.14
MAWWRGLTALLSMKQNLDYASTKGAIVTFTRSLAQQLVDKGIRGPVWTPLITVCRHTTPHHVLFSHRCELSSAAAGEAFSLAFSLHLTCKANS